MSRDLWMLATALPVVVACGGSTEDDPSYPTSGCPPSHEMVDGVCRVKEIYFAGGEFLMGRGYCDKALAKEEPPNVDDCPFTDEPHLVRVEPFWVDATVVTVQDANPSENCPSGAIECGATHHPRVQLSSAYSDWWDYPQKWKQRSPLDKACAKFGKRQLREAEWEWIATGGGTREYPWGDEAPSCDRANIDVERCGMRGRTIPEVLYEGLSETARYPPSPEGVYDLIGGAPEWVAPSPGAYPADVNYTPNPPFAPPCPDDCEWPIQTLAMTRGGSATSPPEHWRPAYRSVGFHISFRCARSAE